jgi:hypothetical protein
MWKMISSYILMISACGTPVYLECEPELQEYFCTDRDTKGRFIKVSFMDLPTPFIAVCISDGTNLFKIGVNSVLWYPLTESQKLRVVEHEFGHCIHDLPHSDDPDDYMYPTI